MLIVLTWDTNNASEISQFIFLQTKTQKLIIDNKINKIYRERTTSKWNLFSLLKVTGFRIQIKIFYIIFETILILVSDSIQPAKGNVIGVGFCKYDITTAEMESMKLDMICLVSSLYLVLAKLIQEQ